MRNLFIVALLGVAFAFPGKVQATEFHSVMVLESQEMSPALVEDILRRVEQETGYDFDISIW